MHGKGMLVLKSGKIYPGTFVNGVISEYEADLALEEKHWTLQKEMNKMQSMQRLAEMKNFREEELLNYLRDTNQSRWLLELKKLGKEKEGQLYLDKISGGHKFPSWLQQAQELGLIELEDGVKHLKMLDNVW